MGAEKGVEKCAKQCRVNGRGFHGARMTVPNANGSRGGCSEAERVHRAKTLAAEENAKLSLLFDGYLHVIAAVGTGLASQCAFLVGIVEIDHAVWPAAGTRFRVQQQVALDFAYNLAVRKVTDLRGEASLGLSAAGEEK
jgi:hypothetical protein